MRSGSGLWTVWVRDGSGCGDVTLNVLQWMEMRDKATTMAEQRFQWWNVGQLIRDVMWSLVVDAVSIGEEGNALLWYLWM